MEYFEYVVPDDHVEQDDEEEDLYWTCSTTRPEVGQVAAEEWTKPVVLREHDEKEPLFGDVSRTLGGYRLSEDWTKILTTTIFRDMVEV